MKVHKLGKILNVGNPVAINTEVNLVDFTCNADKFWAFFKTVHLPYNLQWF